MDITSAHRTGMEDALLRAQHAAAGPAPGSKPAFRGTIDSQLRPRAPFDYELVTSLPYRFLREQLVCDANLEDGLAVRLRDIANVSRASA